MHTVLRALFWNSIASVVAFSAALVYLTSTSTFTPNPADKQALGECAQL